MWVEFQSRRFSPGWLTCYNALQYAAVMGISADLKLVGNDFSNAASAFFIAYLVAEVPNGKP